MGTAPRSWLGLVLAAAALSGCASQGDTVTLPPTSSAAPAAGAGVVGGAGYAAASAAATAIDREARALAMFDSTSPRDYVDEAAADAAAAGITTAKSPDFPDTGEVTVSSGGASVCLVVGTGSAPGEVRPGPCT